MSAFSHQESFLVKTQEELPSPAVAAGWVVQWQHFWPQLSELSGNDVCATWSHKTHKIVACIFSDKGIFIIQGQKWKHLTILFNLLQILG